MVSIALVGQEVFFFLTSAECLKALNINKCIHADNGDGSGRFLKRWTGAGVWLGPRRRRLLTFERGDHAGAPLLQEALELLPRPLQHGVVLDVAAQVPVVLLKQAVPGQATVLPVRTTQTHTHYDGGERPVAPKAKQATRNLSLYVFNRHFR